MNHYEEKAKELIDKFIDYSDDNGGSITVGYFNAARCAMVTVKELLEATKQEIARTNHFGYIYDTYWFEVKREIDKILLGN